MSVKVRFLRSHVNYFSEILEAWQKSKESPSTKIKINGEKLPGTL